MRLSTAFMAGAGAGIVAGASTDEVSSASTAVPRTSNTITSAISTVTLGADTFFNRPPEDPVPMAVVRFSSPDPTITFYSDKATTWERLWYTSGIGSWLFLNDMNDVPLTADTFTAHFIWDQSASELTYRSQIGSGKVGANSSVPVALLTSATASTTKSSAASTSTPAPSSTPDSPTGTPTSSPAPNAGDTTNAGLSSGAKAGIGVAVAVAVIAALIVALLFFRRKRRSQNKPDAEGEAWDKAELDATEVKQYTVIPSEAPATEKQELPVQSMPLEAPTTEKQELPVQLIPQELEAREVPQQLETNAVGSGEERQAEETAGELHGGTARETK